MKIIKYIILYLVPVLVISYGSDFLTSSGSGSGSTGQKVMVLTVPVPVPGPQQWSSGNFNKQYIVFR
jgi:hypothetical protein